MQRRSNWQALDGVLLLDKPGGMTSNTALQKVRRLFNAAKAGHTGTLDPMATGLLPLAFGEATKFSQMLLDADKVYEARVSLGVETDTGDADGQQIASAPVAVDREGIVAALKRFEGEIEQIPPMYSALKLNGKALYEYARAGIEVERAPRRVCMHALELLDAGPDWFVMRVHCSKGTYVRTLAIDIGRVLGCGAHLAALRRTAIAEFDVGQATPLEVLESEAPGQRMAHLCPADTLVAHLERRELSAEQADAMLQGRTIATTETTTGLVRIYGAEGRFLGLGERFPGKGLSPKRLIATGATMNLRGSD
ncbi:MAG: tRNA pseudouridine(55) synthase TruB [Rhodocyclales bacterium]|nr:tRNA pseudouridine(55) synthase TruB [Rhodocyclales bacterium]